MSKTHEKPFFRDALASSRSTKFYKAIYAIKDKACQTKGIYLTTGVACAVNVQDETVEETTASSISFVVTWNGVVGESNCNKPFILDRISRKKTQKQYRLSTSTVKTSGSFSFLTVQEVVGLKDNKTFKLKSLDIKALTPEEQTSDFKVYSISGEEKLLELQFKYKQVTKKHELEVPNTKDSPRNPSLVGSPIIIDEKFVVGVVGKTVTGQLIPCFITRKELGEYNALMLSF